jgi:hypothetical protein
VRVFANRWFTDVAGKRFPTGGYIREGEFRAEVPLRVGHNSLTVKVTFESYDDDTEKFTVLGRTSATVSTTRKRSVNTGKLDRATANMVTERMDAVYGLCGESDDCGSQIWCFSVSKRRADCPVGVWEYPSSVRECAFVATVRVRRHRVRYGRYGCYGRVNPNPLRHVVRGANPRLHRFRSGPSWMSERNDYGLPRFDARTDRFIP